MKKLELLEALGKKFSIMSRLSDEFKNTIKDKMMEKFKYTNIYQIPKVSKIVCKSLMETCSRKRFCKTF